MTNLLFHFLPLSSIKSRNMLSVRGGVRGVQNFYSISWRFKPFWKIDQKKFLKNFPNSQKKVPNFDKDRLTLLDALLSNFFTVLPWKKIKVKRVYFTVYRFWKKLACLHIWRFSISRERKHILHSTGYVRQIQNKTWWGDGSKSYSS